jgi:hypothetical protein
MEQKILVTLNYNIPRPTRSYFLERFLLVSRVDCSDLQAKKTIQSTSTLSSTLSSVTSSSFPSSPPPHGRHNLSPALSTLTDEETSPYSFNAISTHSEAEPKLCLTTPTKPTKPTAAAASAHEPINSFDDVDLTSNDSQSQRDCSPWISFPLQSSPPYTPQHGYIPSNPRHLREESFARMLLHTTLQVSHTTDPLLFSMLPRTTASINTACQRLPPRSSTSRNRSLTPPSLALLTSLCLSFSLSLSLCLDLSLSVSLPLSRPLSASSTSLGAIMESNDAILHRLHRRRAYSSDPPPLQCSPRSALFKVSKYYQQIRHQEPSPLLQLCVGHPPRPTAL